MKIRIILKIALSISLSLTLCACVTSTSTTVDPTNLRTSNASRKVELLLPQVVRRTDQKIITYTLPPGPYFAIAENDEGTFYQCLSGIVGQFSIDGKSVYMHMRGGVYIPISSRLDATPWTTIEVKNAVAGTLNIDSHAAKQISAGCSSLKSNPDNRPSSTARSPTFQVDVLPTGPGASKVGFSQRVGTNVVASLAVTAISDVILSMDDSKIQSIPVTTENGRPLREAIRQ